MLYIVNNKNVINIDPMIIYKLHILFKLIIV